MYGAANYQGELTLVQEKPIFFTTLTDEFLEFKNPNDITYENLFEPNVTCSTLKQDNCVPELGCAWSGKDCVDYEETFNENSELIDVYWADKQRFGNLWRRKNSSHLLKGKNKPKKKPRKTSKKKSKKTTKKTSTKTSKKNTKKNTKKSTKRNTKKSTKRSTKKMKSYNNLQG
jgi:hypothetical protein